MKNSSEQIVNAFSIDVEGFIESNVQSFEVPEQYFSSTRENYEIEKNTQAVLEVLSDNETKATFFVVGRIGRDIPQVVRAIAETGHEIGCHSFEHLRIFDVGAEEFRQKTDQAKKNLEDVGGQEVCGFRAPDFSITQQSIWALDVLKELGFAYDSSIYPIGMHDVYGLRESEPEIHRLGNGLVEVPMSTIEVLGRRIQFGGGGYFRLYPLWLTRMCLRSINKDGRPGVFYIHPYEVGSVIPRIREISAYRKFRHYYHCRNGGRRVAKMLRRFRFGPIIEVLRAGGWIGIKD